MRLSLLPEQFAVCRLSADSVILAWALRSKHFSLTRTSDELSIVCEEELVPNETKCDRDWRCLKVHGPLDFSLTGVMSSLLAPLAEAGISVFVYSTFETDYLMVKSPKIDLAIQCLVNAGHEIAHTP